MFSVCHALALPKRSRRGPLPRDFDVATDVSPVLKPSVGSRIPNATQRIPYEGLPHPRNFPLLHVFISIEDRRMPT